MRYFIVLLLLIFFSCNSKSKFTISGQLPDKTYDGEKIYLVPIENAVKERVDSAVIRNGKFSFEGQTLTPEIYVIRAKPVLRFNLEELLVVREPGALTVRLDKSSSVSGTPLNDSLQYWKERKMRFDFVNAELVKQFSDANDSLKLDLKQRAEMLNNDATNFHFSFVKNNKENIVGQFVQKIMSGSFTEGQKQMLNKK
jgi:hypothetical protein